MSYQISRMHRIPLLYFSFVTFMQHYMHICVYACAYGDQKTALAAIPQELISLCLKTRFLTSLERTK